MKRYMFNVYGFRRSIMARKVNELNPSPSAMDIFGCQDELKFRMPAISASHDLLLAKIPFDEKLSTDMQECSCSELAIRNAVGTPEIRKFIRGSIPDGTVILCKNDTLKLDAKKFLLESGISGGVVLRQDVITSKEKKEVTVQLGDHFNSKFPAIRMKRILEGPLNGSYEKWFDMEDIACGKYLCSQCNLTGLNTSVDANWCISAIDNSSCGDFLSPTYPVYTPEGIFHHRLEIFVRNKWLAVLHLAFAQARNYPEIAVLYRTPEAMWFYTNPNWRDNRNMPIYLTTEIGIVLANAEEAVFWIQKIEWIDSIDCEFFRGHEVKLIVLDEVEESRRTSYENALRILSRFKELNIKIHVLFYRGVNWASAHLISTMPLIIPYFSGSSSAVQLMSVREFVQEAAKHVPNIPETLRADRNGNIDPGIVTHMPPLVEGLLDYGGLTLIVEHNEVPAFFMGKVIRRMLKKGTSLPDGFWSIRKGVSSMILLPPEFQRQFHETEPPEFSEIAPVEQTINNVCFLDLPEKDAISMFQHAVQEKNIRVVSSPVPELFVDKTSEKVRIFKKIRKFCAREGIGMLVHTKSDGYFLDKLDFLVPDRIVHVYVLKEQKDRYVVETVPVSGEKPPVFSFQVSGNNILSAREENEEILLSVKDRTPRTSESGIAPDFFEKMKGK